MKDPTRLLDASASELELRLLRAAADEQPPAAAMQRLMGKLAVSKLPPAAAGKLSVLPIGMAALGITLAGVVWVATRSTPPPAASAPEPQASHALPSPSPRVTAPTPADDTPGTSSLALEIARIDAVRRTLAADHAKQAIGALQDYQRDFPQGLLRQEADVLSIEAHRRAGDRQRARVLATRFLAEHPDSPHSARVRELQTALGSDAR